jgi:hypothetical protein
MRLLINVPGKREEEEKCHVIQLGWDCQFGVGRYPFHECVIAVVYRNNNDFLDVLALSAIAHGRFQSTRRLGTFLATACVREEGQSGQTYGEKREILAWHFNKAT